MFPGMHVCVVAVGVQLLFFLHFVLCPSPSSFPRPAPSFSLSALPYISFPPPSPPPLFFPFLITSPLSPPSPPSPLPPLPPSFSLSRLGDQVISVNGISLLSVTHFDAVQVLKDTGRHVSLVS